MIFYWLIAYHLSKTSPPPIAVTLCDICERRYSPAKLKHHFSHWGYVLFLTENTEEQNTQGSERWWPLPRPLPRREGEWSPRYPYKKDVGFIMFFDGSLVGVTSHITPLPAGEGLGEGPPPHGLETMRKKLLLNLWVLWEKKIPSKSHRPYLIEWVRSISHRITQMNRTHKASQRH